MTEKSILSPLTGSGHVILEDQIESTFIIQSYRDQYGFDVSKFFKRVEKVYVYRCLDTGYRFYHPFSTAGDGEYYATMQADPNYYMKWKWEYQQTINEIPRGAKVLEIGCGRGAFIKKLVDERNVHAVGIELNPSAAAHGRSEGLTILEQSVELHAEEQHNAYDVVCSFQVLEHIWDVRNFLMASLRALRPGGSLYIGVPNNDSYLKHLNRSLLNMPPHHMGLWNEASLGSLQHVLGVNLDRFWFEPLQPLHYTGYVAAVIERFFQTGTFPNRVLYRVLSPIAPMVVGTFASKITGHTILARYSKP